MSFCLFCLFVFYFHLFVFFCGWVGGSIFSVNEQKKDTSRRVISLDHNMADGSNRDDMPPHFTELLCSFARKLNVDGLK